MRTLTEHLNCAFAALELQFAGARRFRVTNYALRKPQHDTPAKNEPNRNRQRRHHETKSAAYAERLESIEIVMNLRECLAPALARPPASMILVRGNAAGTEGAREGGMSSKGAASIRQPTISAERVC